MYDYTVNLCVVFSCAIVGTGEMFTAWCGGQFQLSSFYKLVDCLLHVTPFVLCKGRYKPSKKRPVKLYTDIYCQ